MASTGVSRISGVDPFVAFKAPCKVAATTNITLSGEQTISSVSCVTDDRVLLTGQTNPIDNGIWLVSTAAWTRATDFNGDRDVVKGTIITIADASVASGTMYVVTSANPIVVGTSSITIAARAVLESGVGDYDSMEALRGSTDSFDFVTVNAFYAGGTPVEIKLYRDGTGAATGSGAAVIAAALAAGTFCNAAGVRYKVSTTQVLTPYKFGAISDGSDAHLFLNAFNDFISANECAIVVYDGTFSVSAKCYIGPSSGSIASNCIYGSPRWNALSAIDEMVEFRNCGGLSWEGMPTAYGTGDSDYADRTCRVGVVIGGSTTASRMKFSGIRAVYFNQTGVSVRTLSTLDNLGDVQAIDCGSGTSTAGASLTANWNTKVDSGSSGSNSQRSLITVDQMPPTTLDTPLLVLISGKIHYVYATDTVASTLSIFPWIDTGLASGTLRYVFGAGVQIVGADAGIVGLDSADVRRCGVGVWSNGLYGANMRRVVSQVCGVGVAIGGDPADGHVGLSIDGLYTETVDFSILRVTRAAINGSICSDYASEIAKVGECNVPRLSSNLLNYSASVLDSIAYQKDGIFYNAQKRPMNLMASTIVLDIFKGPAHQIYRANTQTFSLSAPAAMQNEAFGYDAGFVTVFGTGASKEPTGTITFTPPSGYTANGGASAAFSGATVPADFGIYCDLTTLDFIIWRK